MITAFLVPMTAQLQTNYAQTTVQLLSVLVLDAGASAGAKPLLADTAASLPQSLAPFQAPSLFVAVNALWFLSLVFSLASALLGLVAKQWCREYLRWHSVLSSADVNILLRQMRFESWEEWHVPELLTMIPALLEVALITFFAGLVVFSWTLQPTIFVCVIIPVGSVLVGTFAQKILPIFYRLCPYKTPTCWALARLAGKVHRAARHQRFPSTEQAQQLVDWRAWDMEFASDANFCEMPGFLRLEGTFSHEDADATVDAFRFTFGARAMSWVRKASQDRALLHACETCITHLFSHVRTSPDSHLFLHAVSWPVRITMGWTEDFARVETLFHSLLEEETGTEELNKGMPVLRLRALPRDIPMSQVGPYLTNYQDHFASTVDYTTLLVARRALAARVTWCVEQWIAHRDAHSHDRSLWVHLVARLLIVLRCVPQDYLETTLAGEDTDIDMLANNLTAVYRRLAPYSIAYCDGLVPMVAGILELMGKARFSAALDDVHVSRTSYRMRECDY